MNQVRALSAAFEDDNKPQRIPLLIGGKLWGFFVCGFDGTNLSFGLGLQMRKQAGIAKGQQVPWLRGFP